MRIVVGVASIIVAGSLCSASLGAGPNSKLRGELAQVVNRAEEGVLIRAFRLVQDERSSEMELRSLLTNAPFPTRSCFRKSILRRMCWESRVPWARAAYRSR